jgi:FkbM family methyltransferase
MDNVIHIGAGTCRELSEHIERKAKRVLLIEPDPYQAALLQQKTRGNPGIEVLQLAVGAPDGRAELTLYNHRQLNSRHEPSGLHALFPGLRQIDKVPVELISVATLIARLGLTREQSNLLVIDAPGEEGAIISALIAQDQLALFESVILSCGREPLYVDGEPCRTLLERLQQQGYDVASRDERAGSDWPRWTLRRNDTRIENQRLRAELQRQTELANQREQQLAECQQAAKAEADKQSALAAQYQAEAQKQTQLANQREQQLAQCQQAAKAEADKQSALATQHQAEAQKQTELANQHAQQLEQLREAYAALERDNAIALRMQLLRESDLKDLQQRHAQVVEQKEQQAALLKQLTERLTVASQYLHEREASHQEPTRRERLGTDESPGQADAPNTLPPTPDLDTSHTDDAGHASKQRGKSSRRPR